MVAVPCNSCGAPLPEWELASGERAICPDCGVEHEVKIFPAAFRKNAADHPELAEETEAACFDHPASRAVATCEQCGRFVCELCVVDLVGRSYCPSCTASGLTQLSGPAAAPSTICYDSIALALATIPLLIFPLTILTGPAAVFISLRYWKRPLSLMHRGRWRFVLAILIGLTEAIGLSWLFVYAYLKRPGAAG